MKITILTIFPEFFDSFFKLGLIQRAMEEGIVSFDVVDIREYAENKHKKVDDYPFGGGPGMLMMIQPIYDAMQGRNGKKVYLSPRGKLLNNTLVNELAKEEELVILCGHYEGVDERVIDLFIDEEISIGDYVLSGGEIAANVLIDAIIRRLEGHIAIESVQNESHEAGLLEHHQYTRPRTFQGISVPDYVLSGDHERIRKKRLEESIRLTYQRRRDMFDRFIDQKHDPETKKMIDTIIKEENE